MPAFVLVERVNAEADDEEVCEGRGVDTGSVDWIVPVARVNAEADEEEVCEGIGVDTGSVD